MSLAVLVVDDDNDVSEWLAETLRQASFDVVTASSVPQAVSCLAQQRIDVVVTDYDLNDEQNGGDLLSHVAQRFPSVGRVVCSGADVPSGVGAHALVGKPPTISTLVKVIRALSK